MNQLIRLLKIVLLMVILGISIDAFSFAQTNLNTPFTRTEVRAKPPETLSTSPEQSQNDCTTTLSECIINRLELDISPIEFKNSFWRDIFIGFIIFIGMLILAHPLTSLIFCIIKRLSHNTRVSFLHSFFENLRMPIVSTFYVLGLHLITYLFFHSSKIGRVIHDFLVEVSIIILIWGLVRLSDTLFDNIQLYVQQKNKRSIIGFLHLFKRILRVTIIILGITVVLDNLGLKISAFLTALGLGGAALALASKDVLSNFYGSIAILLDRPFNVGDMVNIQGTRGKVESIGIRSTNIRTPDNTIISIPNSTVATAIIDNQGTQPNTYVNFTLAIIASTPKELVMEVMEGFKTILKQDKDIDPSTVNVVFSKIQPYSLEIEINYGITDRDQNFCKRVKERINYKFMDILKAKSIALAYF